MSKSDAASLTHFDKNGQAHMVDVGDKAHTKRSATASGSIIHAARNLTNHTTR